MVSAAWHTLKTVLIPGKMSIVSVVTQEPCGFIRNCTALGSSAYHLHTSTDMAPSLPSPKPPDWLHPPALLWPALLRPRLWALQEGFPVLGSRTLTPKEIGALLAAHWPKSLKKLAVLIQIKYLFTRSGCKKKCSQSRWKEGNYAYFKGVFSFSVDKLTSSLCAYFSTWLWTRTFCPSFCSHWKNLSLL